MPYTTISVEALSKVYRIGAREEVPDTLIGAAMSLVRSPWNNYHRLRNLDTFSKRLNGQHSDVIWALKDVTFTVDQGEVIGIIGRNGAGKSTLLKILSRITEPTSGRVTIRGRVSSLLEVGTGFHPELTGRENVYMNGTILGMRKGEIDRKFDEIVDFSGVEKFLDTPVKRYSSGMKVRLAFAVAAHLDPEILIVDEVLAVGDAEFQQKCLGRMQTVSKAGRTVLFVSHNLSAVENLCGRGILLERGHITAHADSIEVIRQYVNKDGGSRHSDIDLRDHDRAATNAPIFHSVALLDSDGNRTTTFRCGDSITVALILQLPRRPISPRIGIGFNDDLHRRLFTVATVFSGWTADLSIGTQRIECRVPGLPIVPGVYSLTFGFRSSNGLYDQLEHAAIFEVEAADYFGSGELPSRNSGHFLLPAHWKLTIGDLSNGGATVNAATRE